MIVNFSIKNFGCIKDRQTLSFEAEKSKHLEDFYVHKIKNTRLLKIALIYGANASGKSTVLKALDFLRDLVLEPALKKTEELEFEPFLFDTETPHQNTELAIEFFQNDIKYYYEVEFNRQAIVKEHLSKAPHNVTIFNRTTDLKNQVTHIIFGRKIKIPKPKRETLESNTLWNNTVLGGYLKTNIEIHELKEVTDWFEHYLMQMINSQSDMTIKITSLVKEGKIKKESLLKMLKKADLNISNIQIQRKENYSNNIKVLFSYLPNEIAYNLSKNNIDEQIKKSIDKINNFNEISSFLKVNFNFYRVYFAHYVNEKEYFLPLEQESEGTQRYYGLAGLLTLLIHDRKAVPIDELEASLHPDLFQYFLLAFLANARQSQIIATTHNREILDDKDIIRDDALWITDKSKGAATELYSFADFDSSVIRNTTNRLNAYKSGKLGGIPNLSDYYLNVE